MTTASLLLNSPNSTSRRKKKKKKPEMQEYEPVCLQPVQETNQLVHVGGSKGPDTPPHGNNAAGLSWQHTRAPREMQRFDHVSFTQLWLFIIYFFVINFLFKLRRPLSAV